MRSDTHSDQALRKTALREGGAAVVRKRIGVPLDSILDRLASPVLPSGRWLRKPHGPESMEDL